MNSDQSRELMQALAELQLRYPDWRFGQMIANLADWSDQNVWDIEDELLLATVRRHLESIEDRAQRAGV